MPNMANMTLVGPGAVNWVFKPVNVVGGEATFVKSTGVPLADQVAKIKVTRTASGRVKVDLRLSLPVVQDMEVNGVTRPTIVRTAYFNGTLSADATSTTAERQELLELVNSLNGGANNLAAFKDLEYFT
jgi:hypothetical protein